jgi:hypothetical protein
MSQDAETTKALMAFKKKLELKIEKMNTELKELQTLLEAMNSLLLEKGFRHPEITVPTLRSDVSVSEEKTGTVAYGASAAQSAEGLENVTPLKSKTGELLANLYVEDDSLRVVPAEGKDFDINTPPFTHFLLERVLLKMQERDSELARNGQLPAERIFCYNIRREGNVIREIVVNNAGPDRMRELKSSVRWTLEKMYEKMSGKS